MAYKAQCLQWQCKIACTCFFFLLHLVSNDVKLHTSFFLHHLLSNDIKLHTSFQTKLNPIENCTHNARRVLRSPSARASNTMAKRKRAITDLQNTTQKTIISPSNIFFHRKQKSDFYFLDINKKSVNSLQIFIINFSLGTVGPD